MPVSRRYDDKVDVFSFGVVLWALWMGTEPYSNMRLNPFQLMARVSVGLRPPLVPSMPSWLTSLLRECWHAEPHRRPSFDVIVKTLERNDSQDRLDNGRGGSQRADSFELENPPVKHRVEESIPE